MTPTKRNSKKAPKKDRPESTMTSAEALKHAIKCLKLRITNYRRKFYKTLTVRKGYFYVTYRFLANGKHHIIERQYSTQRHAMRSIYKMADYVEYLRHGTEDASLRSTANPSESDESTNDDSTPPTSSIESEETTTTTSESTATLYSDSFDQSEVSTAAFTYDSLTHSPTTVTDDVTFEDLQDEVSFDAFAQMLPPPPATAYIEDVDEVVETAQPVQPDSPLTELFRHLKELLLEEPTERVITEEEQNQPEHE
jgi:hypothetical protein